MIPSKFTSKHMRAALASTPAANEAACHKLMTVVPFPPPRAPLFHQHQLNSMVCESVSECVYVCANLLFIKFLLFKRSRKIVHFTYSNHRKCSLKLLKNSWHDSVLVTLLIFVCATMKSWHVVPNRWINVFIKYERKESKGFIQMNYIQGLNCSSKREMINDYFI